MPGCAMQLMGQGLQVMPVHVKYFGWENAGFLAILGECEHNHNVCASHYRDEYGDTLPTFAYRNYSDYGYTYNNFIDKFQYFKDMGILDFSIVEKQKETIEFNFYYNMVAKLISWKNLRDETPPCFHELNKQVRDEVQK